MLHPVVSIVVGESELGFHASGTVLMNVSEKESRKHTAPGVGLLVVASLPRGLASRDGEGCSVVQ